jgi:hypothetical protein
MAEFSIEFFTRAPADRTNGSLGRAWFEATDRLAAATRGRTMFQPPLSGCDRIEIRDAGGNLVWRMPGSTLASVTRR